jgi:hypothetical protein
MKPTEIPLKHLVLSLAVLAAALWHSPLQAQALAGKGVVRAIKGSANYSTDGVTFLPLKTGAVLPPGSVIKTAPASTVDVFLGSSAGIIRIEENSTLALDKLTLTDTGADTVVDVQLNLPEGTMLFNAGKLSAASKYEIKVPNGVAGIRGTKGRVASTSYIVLLDGTLIFVYVPTGQQPVPYTLVAPPPVYFSPLEGVKPAPQDLIREVVGQFAALTPGAREGIVQVGAPPQAPVDLVTPGLGVQWGAGQPLPTEAGTPTPYTNFEDAAKDPDHPYPTLSPYEPVMQTAASGASRMIQKKQ